ncbi:Hypothetical predicted protein [Scomber scombrus]|uniref:Uncharacterized protein n=1 Tax=Scomber scombrus TaxID=13677 RepID=A0AAV1Q8P6_SCOSC
MPATPASPPSDRSVSLSHGHRVQDASNHCCLLTPITALRSNGNIGHRDAHNHCCLLTPITVPRLDQNIGTRMPTTPAVSSLHPHHFYSARMLSHIQRNLHVIISCHFDDFIINAPFTCST